MVLNDYVEFNPRIQLSAGPVPFVPMDAIIPGYRWVHATASRQAGGSGAKFNPGDTLFARITPCLENGKIAQYLGEQPGLGSTEFFVLHARKNISDPAFVFYFSQNDSLRRAAEKSMTGASGRQRADVTALKDFECEFPSLPVQQEIAGILSAYDELIENNQRRIRILEEMARRLYREWLVEFRFPGHEKHPRIASPLGEIPKGWPLKRVVDCVQLNPRVAIPKEGEKPFVPMTCLSNDSMLITDIESRSGNSGSKFEVGDTLFARITPCLENGKTGFVHAFPNGHIAGFGSTEFIVLRGITVTPEYVYCLARSEAFREHAIKSMTGASGRQRVQEASFNQFFIAEPPSDLLAHFSSLIAPSFRLIYQLHLQIQNLRRTRDLLLPRLLSGQIDLGAS